MTSARYSSLQGKSVVVTGGASGIGAALVEAFVNHGSKVTLVDRADAAAASLCRRIERAGGGVRYVRCDLAVPSQIEEAFAGLIADAGPVEVLVNNVANDERHLLEDISNDYWDKQMRLNLAAAVFATKSVAPGMVKKGGGVIVNISSIAPHVGLPHMPLYLSAKGGLEGLTRALARDLGESHIRVVCVVPGAVDTERQRQWHSPEEERRLFERQCLHARIQPSDVANLVTFLASDDASMCTGRNFHIDAGWV